VTTTRRGFLAGALAGGAVPASVARAAAPAAAGPLQAERETVRRGRAIAVAPDGRRLVVAHDQRRTIAISAPGRDGARLVDVGGQPLAVAVSPDGRLAAVITAFWDEPGAAVVALQTGELLTRVAVGPAPYDVAFAGDRLVVSGGEQEGTVHVLDAQSFQVVAQAALGAVPRGVAAEPGGDAAWIALCGRDRVLRVHLGSGRVLRELRTPALPERLALSPDGGRLLVSHAGTEAERVSEIDLASGGVIRRRAGRLPSAVCWTRRGRGLVTLGGAGEIVELGPSGGRTSHAVGGAPRGLAVAGRRAWTVDSLGGAVSEVRL
jgi:DNA-binding beta-propeller fold protein YncE